MQLAREVNEDDLLFLQENPKSVLILCQPWQGSYLQIQRIKDSGAHWVGEAVAFGSDEDLHNMTVADLAARASEIMESV